MIYLVTIETFKLLWRTICYKLRNLPKFQTERKKNMFYGLETISYRAPHLSLPEEFKQRNTISLFKSDFKQRKYNTDM